MAKRKRESTGPSTSSDSGAKTPEENPEQEASSSTAGRDKKRRKLSSTKSTDPQPVMPPRKTRTWSEEDMAEAIEAVTLCKMSQYEASKTFKIPKSTLNDRISGRTFYNPKNVPIWNETIMASAIEAVMSSQMNIRKASEVFNIPKSTLGDRIAEFKIRTPKKESLLEDTHMETVGSTAKAGTMKLDITSKSKKQPTSTPDGRHEQHSLDISRKGKNSTNTNTETGASTESGSVALDYTSKSHLQRKSTLDNKPAQCAVKISGKGKACEVFNIPKSTSGDRVTGSFLRSRGALKWTNTNMNAAVEAVTSGQMTQHAASIAFNIPKSTLSDHCCSGKRNYKKEKSLKNSQMEDSAKAVQSGQMTGPEESNIINVTRSMLCHQSPEKSGQSNSKVNSSVEISGKGNNSTDVNIEAGVSTTESGSLTLENTSKLHLQQKSTPENSRNAQLTHKISRKRKKWTIANISAAVEAVTSGQMTQRGASKAFNIPKSTLRSKIVCNPKNVPIWKDTDMVSAIEAVMSGQMNRRKASEVFNIPKTTLYDRIAGLTAHNPEKESLLEDTHMETVACTTTLDITSKSKRQPKSTVVNKHAQCSVNISRKIETSTNANKEGVGTVYNPKNIHVPAWNESDMASAKEAVISGKMNRRKACEVFNIPKSTLGDRLTGSVQRSRRALNWTNTSMDAAVEAVNSGQMTQCAASKAFNIPKSTLSDHCCSEKRNYKKEKSLNNSQMEDAVKAAQSGQMTGSEESKIINVTRSMLCHQSLEKSDQSNLKVDSPLEDSNIDPANLFVQAKQIDKDKADRMDDDSISAAGHQCSKFDILQSSKVIGKNAWNSSIGDKMPRDNYTDVLDQAVKSKHCRITQSEASVFDQQNALSDDQIASKDNKSEKETNMEAALEAVRSGRMNQRTASKAFNIPRTTLSDRYLGKTGPKSRSAGEIWKYHDMEAAARSVLRGELLHDEAAKKYNVPISALKNRLGRPGVQSGKGASMFLMQDDKEQLVVSHLIECIEKGYTTYKEIGMCMATLLAKQHGHNIKGTFLDLTWWKGFLDRHPEIQSHIEDHFYVQTATVTANIIQDYYESLYKAMNRHGHCLQNTPEMIFTCNEVRFDIDVINQNVADAKGGMHISNDIDNQQEIRVITCVTAIGNALPPFLLYQSDTGSLSEDIITPSGVLLTALTRNPYSKDIYLEWLRELFLPSIPIQRPVMLIVDGQTSIITAEFKAVAAENNIVVFCTPGNCSALLHPLQNSILGQLSKGIVEVCADEEPVISGVVNQRNFANIFTDAWNCTLTPEVIQEEFSKSGIYPYNPDIFDYSRLDQSDDISPTNAQATDDTSNDLLEVVVTAHLEEVDVTAEFESNISLQGEVSTVDKQEEGSHSFEVEDNEQDGFCQSVKAAATANVLVKPKAIKQDEDFINCYGEQEDLTLTEERNVSESVQQEADLSNEQEVHGLLEDDIVLDEEQDYSELSEHKNLYESVVEAIKQELNRSIM